MKFFGILFSVILMMSLCGCEVQVNVNPTNKPSDGDSNATNTANSPKSIDEETLYHILMEKLPKGQFLFEIKGNVELDVLQSAVARIEHEHPEYYWLDGTREITTDGTLSTVEFSSYDVLDAQKLKNDVLEIETAANEIISQMPAELDDYGKILYIHDYLASHIVYATKEAETLARGPWNNVYGSLVDGYAVCSGYAAGFSYLMKQLDIECGVVTGEVVDEESGESNGHAWNYVKLDNQYYWIDVTWDDTDKENNPVNHYYFLIDDTRMNQNRTLWENQYFVPKCTSMDNSFYARNGSYFTSYSAEAVKAALLSSPYDNKVELLFADKASYEAALADLIDNHMIWELSDFTNKNVSYTRSDDLNTLVIYYLPK